MTSRFVIQEHSRSGKAHWDLMLESGNILKTWRLGKPPEHIGNEPVNAAKIFDHDLKFLAYEGPVNKGRGNVRIVDEGTFETLQEDKQVIRLYLEGKILSGAFVLKHIERKRWQFLKNS
jgi:hypothetical protein